MITSGCKLRCHGDHPVRSEIFLTTKVHPRYFGYEQTLQSFDRSLQELDVEVVRLRGDETRI
jgi:diketogulonate reductase-like aldo/keto reductase